MIRNETASLFQSLEKMSLVTFRGYYTFFGKIVIHKINTITRKNKWKEKERKRNNTLWFDKNKKYIYIKKKKENRKKWMDCYKCMNKKQFAAIFCNKYVFF